MIGVEQREEENESDGVLDCKRDAIVAITEQLLCGILASVSRSIMWKSGNECI